MQLNRGRENDYIKKSKDNTIQTPKSIANCIYDNICDKVNLIKEDVVLDIGCGHGNLSEPFFKNSYNVVGVDIEDYGNSFHSQFFKADFLNILKLPIKKPKLILCNPPWNNPRSLYGRSYLPELFLKQIFKLFGDDVKVVMLTSWTLLMNNDIKKDGDVSKRYNFLRNMSANITSVLEVPKNIFDGANLWNHVIFFNINSLKPVCFIDDKYLKEL